MHVRMHNSQTLYFIINLSTNQQEKTLSRIIPDSQGDESVTSL